MEKKEILEMYADGVGLPTDLPTDPPVEPVKEYTKYSDIPQFYDMVRKISSSKMSQASNETIDYAIYAPMAEKNIKARVPNWKTLGADFPNEDKLGLFEMAIVYQTAALIYPDTLGSPYKQTQTVSIKIEYKENDFDVLSHLQNQIEILVNTLNGVTSNGYAVFSIT